MNRINVTQPFLPPIGDYKSYIDKIFEANILTNNGPLVKDFEKAIKSFLDVKYFQFLANGTVALQLALNALDISSGEIITTPFSYVATTSSILWERCKPVFVDIEPNNFTINADKIESSITENTKAILAVHVFGYACNVKLIDKIAKKYNLKVIYDGAHAFGSFYQGKSLLSYGDVATLSFHATKLFHTIEGGGCVSNSEKLHIKIDLAKRFGHHNDEYSTIGINAKNSEFHAAMGLACFPYITQIISTRKQLSQMYDYYLPNFRKPLFQEGLEYNYSYYPVVFEDEKSLKHAVQKLNKHNIFPRRYFYPSLNNLPYIQSVKCEISEKIASSILCLPLYVGLEQKTIEQIGEIVNG